ncbi:MAG: kelch repeat-containing protein [Pyrinomonadaceae bacterium]
MKDQRNHTRHPRSLIVTLAGLIAASTLLLLLCQASLTFAQTPAPGWSYTGDLNIARSDFTATLLPNGKVLVVGGYSPAPQTILNSAELYDPSTGTWSFTGSLNAPRLAHSATLLQNGKVLVAGGVYNISPPVGNFWLKLPSYTTRSQEPGARPVI